jgi:hypothetical protein
MSGGIDLILGKDDHDFLLSSGFLVSVVYAVYLTVRMAVYTRRHVTRRIDAEDHIRDCVLS